MPKVVNCKKKIRSVAAEVKLLKRMSFRSILTAINAHNGSNFYAACDLGVSEESLSRFLDYVDGPSRSQTLFTSSPVPFRIETCTLAYVHRNIFSSPSSEEAASYFNLSVEALEQHLSQFTHEGEPWSIARFKVYSMRDMDKLCGPAMWNLLNPTADCWKEGCDTKVSNHTNAHNAEGSGYIGIFSKIPPLAPAEVSRRTNELVSRYT